VGVFVVGGLLLFLVVGRGTNKTPTPTQQVAAGPTTTTTAPGSVVFPIAPPTTLIQFKIPAGKSAVAIPMEYFAGVGGFVRPADVINIYVMVNKDCATPNAPAAVKLLLSNVKVLEVLGAAPAATGTPASYLLALTPQEAERVIFASKYDSLYMALTTDNSPPATTSGVDCKTAL
jgi:Flp pilus assembly protein CpaB